MSLEGTKNSIAKIDRDHLTLLAITLLDIYEKQMPFLACNTTPPNERNAYFALSNAIRVAAGGGAVLAATEVELEGRRRIDAAYVVGKTLYVVELKAETARMVHTDFYNPPKKRQFSDAVKVIEDATDQLNEINRNSPFVNNAISRYKLTRLVTVGFVIANVRASENQRTGEISERDIKRGVVTGFGKLWGDSMENVCSRKYDVAYRSVKFTGVEARVRPSKRIQYEAGTIAFVCARVAWSM